MQVPFVDLAAHHRPLRPALDAALAEVLDSNYFAGGPVVAKFEEEFAAFCGSRFAIGVGSGTEALWLSLLALGIGPGDEVITVPNTFLATAEAISYCGATPVFVDVDPVHHTLDPKLLPAAITSRTKAIIPVHLYGQTADLDPILEIARNHGLAVVEDSCQAHGAEYKGRKAGTCGVTGCFSFYPGKNLGAMGEAGAIVTDDPTLAATLQSFRDHGQSKRYHHSRIGWNARMDAVQAAVLRVKLRHLPRWNTQRRAHARVYQDLMADLEEVVLPQEAAYSRHVYHLYPIRVPHRDQVLRDLAELGVMCGIHYPVPVHRQPAYHHLELGVGSFPVAEAAARELLSLPMFPELTCSQAEYVVTSLRSVLARPVEHERRP